MLLVLTLISLYTSINSLSFNVNEEQSAGTFVGQLAGIDPAGTYCFTSTCGWSSLFSFNKQSGVINTTTQIDREQLLSDTITLRLEGIDSNHNNILEVFTIIIDDINDNNPQFSDSEYTVYVSEELGPQTIDLLSWSDADIGENGKLKKVQIIDLEDQSWPFRPQMVSSGDFQQVVLQITQSLDREIRDRYSITIEIEDNGYPSLTGTLELIIEVQDINDNSPVFDQSTYSFNIDESVSIPYSIYQFLATDADADANGRIQYSLSHNYAEAYFAIDQNNGSFSLQKLIDYETCPFIRTGIKGFSVIITAYDMASSPRDGTANVEILVLDVNDNYPLIQFFSPFMINDNTVELEENIPVDSYTATIIVSDKDSGTNGQVIVTIDGGDFGKFKLQSSDGLVVLTAENLDREDIPSYEIVISASDGGNPSLKTSKTLFVNILDVNDNAPVFTEDLYTQLIQEDADIDKFVLAVQAVDSDNGVNGSVFYRIESQSGGTFFKISPNGRISNIRELDAEQFKYHILNVSASDSGNPSLQSYVVVNISVVDVNDNMPIFAMPLFTCETPETDIIHTPICSVIATDADEGINGEISYSLVTSSDVFNINSSTGQVYLIASLDFEVASVHRLVVQADDGGTPSKYTTCELVVNVEDINDEKPHFNPSTYTASLPEDNIYSSIVQIYAEDGDYEDIISFSVLAYNQYFAISSDGVISNTQELVYSQSSSYSFEVSATDTAGNNAVTPASVTINILENTNDLPIFPEGIIRASVQENEAVGTDITTVAATTNSGCSLTYRFEQASDDIALVTTSGLLKIKSLIDYEVTTSIVLDIVAACGNVEGYAKVQIEVIDVNDNSPSCDVVSGAYVLEDTAVGTRIHSCICSDADDGLNSELTYSLTSSFFSVGADDGDITVATSLDRETHSSHSITISVCDKGSPILCVDFELTVYILDINDNVPQFMEPLTFYVSEDVKINYQIGQLNAFDNDEGENSRLFFSVLNSVPEISVFGSGQLVVEQLLDFEIVDRYFLNVKVRDNGNPPNENEAFVSIIVEDANDNKPEFDEASYTFSISEDQSVPYSIGFVTATDNDSGRNGEVDYSLLSNNDMFQIDNSTGELVLTGSLDYEGANIAYSVVVQATDGGTVAQKSQIAVFVNVADVNDNAPIFSQNTYSATTLEDVSIGSEVLQVFASDSDGPDNNQLSYSLENTYGKFRIDSDSGRIFTTNSLDFETQHTYNITVVANDNGSPALFASATVVVMLSDVNDNSPYFDSDIIEIGMVESTVPGTVVITIQAADLDSDNNGRLTYSITSESDSGCFRIDGNSGDLILLQTLTFSSKIYQLTVEAIDHGTTPLSASQDVRISVIDVNDNAPVFDDDITSASVEENAELGTVIFQVSASDSDSGPAGIVNYNISSNVFAIDRTSGIVSVAGDIDREVESSIVVTVCAADQASPVSEQLVTCKGITLTVLDVNDNAPYFTDDNAEIYVHEVTMVNEKITRINVTDLDFGINASVSFRIISQSPENIVSIGTTSGDLKLLQAVDFEANSNTYSIVVEVSDNGTPSLSSSQLFNLIIVDDNDNVPIFSNPVLQRVVYISSSVESGDVIFIATATDADSGINGQILYSLQSASNEFIIDQETGKVKVQSIPISFTSQQLTIIASDQGVPVLSTSMIVNVELREENTKPVCPEKTYVTVTEGEPDGTTLFNANCYDLDWGDNGLLIFSILNGNIDEIFQIDGNGDVILVGELDFELSNQYNIVILVEDNGKPSLKEVALVVINVLNINDNAPLFSTGDVVVELLEDTLVGGLVQTFVATDIDEDPITYSQSTSTEECLGYFTLNSQTGQLTLSHTLLDLTNSTMLCQIEVAANDGMFNTVVKLSIVIIDVDNTSPVFYSSASFNVEASSSVVGAVGATDGDVGDSVLLYSIVSTKRSAGFSMNSQSGVITCPDLTCQRTNLNVEATGRTLSSTRSIAIDYSTSTSLSIFANSTYSFSVRESESVSYIVGGLSVLNSPDVISIEGGNYGDSFAINNLNIIVNRGLDYEKWSRYNLTLAATLENISTFSFVYIDVEDVNDNTPIFLPSSILLEIPSSTSVGEIVIQANAEDKDSYLNGQLVYYLEQTAFSDYFAIETATGNVYIARSLQDTCNTICLQYATLEVKARDQGVRPLTSTSLEILITIVHQPVPPQFSKSMFNFTAYADATAYSYIGQVEVEAHHNSKYQFSFDGDSQYFAVYSDSGKIVQKASIHDDEVRVIKESVKATLTTNASVYGSTDVWISVIQSICSPNPCDNDGVCKDLITSFECQCTSGTAGKTCQCVDSECSNHGSCIYNATEESVDCLCRDGDHYVYKDNCNSDSMLLIAVIAGAAIVIIIIVTVILVCCIIKHKSKNKVKKAAKDDFKEAMNGARLGSNKRLKGQLHLQDNICMNPINVSNLDIESKQGYPEFSYTNHDYDLDSPNILRSPSQQSPHSFPYAESDSGHSSATEAVIFRKLKQVDVPSSQESRRRDKDSGLAGSLNTLCHFDMDINNEAYAQDYLVNWGPKVQNLVNILDLEDVVLDDDTPIKEEFV